MTRPSEVLTVEGYGISLIVRRGQLRIESGLGTDRATQLVDRASRSTRRILVLADTGTVSLDALRWCADVGIAVVQLDRDSRLLMTNAAPGTDDPRLRRAQAAAPTSPVGVHIARALLLAKLDGQAANLVGVLNLPVLAEAVDKLRKRAHEATDLRVFRDLEAAASNIYFGAWASTVHCGFATDHADRVPRHWQGFTVRRSPLHRGKTNRSAANPTNALLNYGYALAEAECRIAAIRVGLDPGLGIVHTDTKSRDSLALDLLEPLRPVVERHVLRLLAARRFTREHFGETRDGTCRILEPLTRELADLMPALAVAVGPLAEGTAHALAQSSPGKIELRTPLSRANSRSAQTRGAGSVKRRDTPQISILPSCRTCGDQLYDVGRQLCPTCWPVTRDAYAQRRNEAGQVSRAAAVERGEDPTQTPQARERRRVSLLAMKSEEADWKRGGHNSVVTEADLHQRIIPALANCSLRLMQKQTGLSNSSCSRIRAGKMTPHPRHWDVLAKIAAGSKTIL